MPLSIAKRFPPLLASRLERMGVRVAERPESQLRIGLLNLMPAASRDNTIEQFFSLVGANSAHVTPVLMRFDEYVPRSGREAMLTHYEPFSEVRTQGLDGLIVTGANLELTPDESAILPASDIFFHKEWSGILDWARANVRSTIYSCLGAHVALEHFHGLVRAPLGNTTFNQASGSVGEPRKTFGVFNHTLDHSLNPALTSGMNDEIRAPHSRWGDVTLAEVQAHSELQVLAASEQSGWHMMIGPDSREVYLQGHPEYYAEDLASEYLRDKKAGMNPLLPLDYFPGNDDAKMPLCSWRADAHVFYRNWMELLLRARTSQH